LKKEKDEKKGSFLVIFFLVNFLKEGFLEGKNQNKKVVCPT
jgi:hypothetical protein